MFRSVSASLARGRTSRGYMFARYCLPLIPLAVILSLLTPFLAPYQEYAVLYEIVLALVGFTDPYALPAKVESLVAMPRVADPAVVLVVGLVVAYVAVDLAIAAIKIYEGDRALPTSQVYRSKPSAREPLPRTLIIVRKILFFASLISLFSSLAFGVSFDSQFIMYTAYNSFWTMDSLNALLYSMAILMLVLFYFALSTVVTLWYGAKKRVTASHFWFRIPQQIALTLKDATSSNGVARWLLVTVAVFVNGALVTLLAFAIYAGFAFVFVIFFSILLFPYAVSTYVGGRR